MKIACYSDLHGTLLCLPREKVDLAIFSGDIAGHNPNGLKAGNASDFDFQFKFLFDTFIPYLKTFPCPVIFIAGNHDLLLDKTCTGKFWKHKKKDVTGLLAKELAGSAVFYLNRTLLEINGLKVWGSPYVPYIRSHTHWSFMYPQWDCRSFAQGLYADCPDDVDILITHGPPAGILDGAGAYGGGYHGHVGCDFLSNALNTRLKPKLHCFGHYHAGRGIDTRFNTKFVNAACSGEGNYGPTRLDGNPYHIQSMDPIIIDI